MQASNVLLENCDSNQDCLRYQDDDRDDHNEALKLQSLTYRGWKIKMK